MRPKKIIVCLGLPVILCKRLSRVTSNFLVFKKKNCIGYIGHVDVPTLTVLVEKN
jgi:hypothetical protein